VQGKWEEIFEVKEEVMDALPKNKQAVRMKTDDKKTETIKKPRGKKMAE